MNDEPGMGIVETASALDEVRLEIGATMVMAFFDTARGKVTLVCDADGVGMFCDGEPVPMELP